MALQTVLQRTYRAAAALHLKPDLLPEFLDEEKTSDTDNDFRKKFSEKALQGSMDERFGKQERGSHANHDKSLHGSSVGTKIFYARIRHNKDGTKGGDLIFNAFVEKEKAEGIINILSVLTFDMCGIFMEHYSTDDFVRNKKSEYEKLHKAEIKGYLRYDLRNP